MPRKGTGTVPTFVRPSPAFRQRIGRRTPHRLPAPKPVGPRGAKRILQTTGRRRKDIKPDGHSPPCPQVPKPQRRTPTYRPRKALRQSRFPRTANRPAIPQKPEPASRKRRRSSPNVSETTSYRNSSGDGRDDSPAEARNAAVRPAPVRRPVRPKGGPTARTAFRRADSRLRRPCR